MDSEASARVAEIAGDQDGIVTRAQALEAGLTEDAIKAHVAAQRWQRLLPATYATFTGTPPRRSWLWAVVLWAGPDAVLSHNTAAELTGLTDRPTDPVHVTVPANRQLVEPKGVRVHRSRRAPRGFRRPPRTVVEETVLDLYQAAPNADRAVGWLMNAVSGQFTTSDRLADSADRRRRLRWRDMLHSALADIRSGCHSMLELLYLRNVERAHNLPTGERQATRARAGGRYYDDVRYAEYQIIVELDGRAAHPPGERFRDHQRDNSAVADGWSVLRYGWGDVRERPCLAALQLAAMMVGRGWSGPARRCRRKDCQIA